MDKAPQDTPPSAKEVYDPRRQGGQFDKIIKENIKSSISLFLGRLLGVSYDSITLVSPDIQITLERKTDVLVLIKETPSAAPYLYHLEFQSNNSPQMAVRMLVYNGMLRSHYNLPIKQRVIYLGSAPVDMPNEIRDDEHLQYSFPILDVRTLQAQELIAAQIPEEVVFAILADYGDLPPEAVLRALILRLKELVTDPIRLQTYILQVGVLVQLRSLESVFTKTIETMPVEIDEDRIPFVSEALRKARTISRAEGITQTLEIMERLRAGEQDLLALAREFDLTVEQVAEIQRMC